MSASTGKPIGGRQWGRVPAPATDRSTIVRCDWLNGVEVDPRASLVAARRSFVSVLFTDIVDSTRHALEMGDHRWLELLEAYEAMVTRAVERFRGYVVRTTGDGTVATFVSAVSAALCAARIAEHSESFGIEVRVGLHAGECERRGRTLGGLVFHIGARVAGLAGAGQILASRTIVDLLVGSGLEFEPFGRHVLKGLAGEWSVFELRSREADIRHMR